MLEERVLDREVRVSLYDNESFASAEYRKLVQILRDGEPVGMPEWRPAPITQDALKALLGDAAVIHRDHVAQVEQQMRELRLAHRAEIEALMQAVRPAQT